MIVLVNVYTSSLVLLDSLYSTKCLYLVSLSVITYIALYITFVIGSFDGSNLTIKSIAINFQALLGVSSGCSNP